MTEIDFQCLNCVIDITDEIHKTKTFSELIKAIKVEFELEVTLDDIERYYNQIENTMSFNNFYEEDYVINHKICI